MSEHTWRRLSAACCRRDGGRCRRCRRPGDVADHLIPTAWRRPPAGFQRHLAGLMWLCRTCHDAKTRKEAAMGRLYDGLPPDELITQHVRWWLSDIGATNRAAL